MLSFVIPALNEAESLAELHAAIAAECSRDFEIIFVDDGSTDRTWKVISQLAHSYPQVKGLRFRKNFGKAAALVAGFQKARGEIILMMDADLQDDPKNLPRFLKKLDEGFDVVSGWRSNRQDKLKKRLVSHLFNKTVSVVTGVNLHDHNCGFKAFRADAAKNLKIYGELHRYLTALSAAAGYRVSEVQVVHNPRKYGRSKYGLWRMVSGMLDLVTVVFLSTFKHRPLHIFGLFGLSCFLLGFVGLAYLATIWFFGEALAGRPLLIYSAAAMIMGGQFMLTGIIAELITASANHQSYEISDEIENIKTQQQVS